MKLTLINSVNMIGSPSTHSGDNSGVDNVNSSSVVNSNNNSVNKSSAATNVNSVNNHPNATISVPPQVDTNPRSCRNVNKMSDTYIVASEVCKSKEAAALTYWCTMPLNETAPHVGKFSDSLMAIDTANDVAYLGTSFFNSNTLGFHYNTGFTVEGYHPAKVRQDSESTSDDSILDAELFERLEITSKIVVGAGASAGSVPERRTSAKHVVKSKEDAAALLAGREYYLPQDAGLRLYHLCVKNVTDRHDRIGSSSYWISTHGNFKHKKTIQESEKLYSSVGAAGADPVDADCEVSLTVDPKLQYYSYPKYMPLSHCQVTRSSTSADLGCQARPPTTSVFDQFKAKLLENDAKDALRSMISRPAVVDGASLLSLVNSMLMTEGSSFRDVYPLLTCHLILNATDTDLATTSSDWSRMVRQLGSDSDSNVGVRLKEYAKDAEVPQLKVSYVSFARFIQLLAGIKSEAADSPWHRSKFDQTWIAIPVTSELLTMKNMLGYIMAFMHSDAWAGRIVWWKVIEYLTDHDASDTDVYNGVLSQMPASNSVYMPGPRNIMLVQMVGSSATNAPTIDIPGANVGFTVDTAAAIVTTDLRPAWRAAFTNAGLSELRQTFFHAYHFLLNRLTAGDAAGRAAFLAADISSKTSPGLGLVPKENGLGYDNGKAVRGLWSYKAQRWGQENWQSSDWLDKNTKEDHTAMDKRISGYNFSLTSPVGVCPVSWVTVAGTEYTYSLKDGSSYKMGLGYWKQVTPDFLSAPNYVVQMAGSFNRLAAASHLIDTHTVNGPYHFSDIPAITSFDAHLASALSGSLAIFLLQNDIEYRHWVGWDAAEHRGFYSTLAEIKRTLFLGQLNNTPPSIVRSPADTIDLIEDYYGVSYADGTSFMVCTPYPTCCTLQWAEKVESAIAEAGVVMSSVSIGGKRIQGVRLEEGWGVQKALMTGFVNDRSAKPVVYVSCGTEEKPFYQDMWVENLGASTYFQSRSNWTLNYAPSEIETLPILSTLTYTRAFKSPLEFDTVPTISYITSGLMGVPKGRRRIRVSPVVLPDPFSLDSFLGWLRDYVARPAISAGKEYINSGSIPRSAMAAGEEIERQMDRRQREQARREEVESRRAQPTLSTMPSEAELQMQEEKSDN
nr:MAG: hypothetical protein [Sogatella furcifera totivirus 1]